eukprot:g3825.t1
MGNACSRRWESAVGGEAYYRRLFEEQAERERLAKEAEQELVDRATRQEAEDVAAAAAKLEEKKKFLRDECRALVLEMVAKQERATIENVKASTVTIDDKVEKQIGFVTGQVKQISDVSLPHLDDLLKQQAARVDTCATNEALNKVQLDNDLELEALGEDAATRITELEKRVDELRVEVEQQRDNGENDFRESKMLISSLEQEVRNVGTTLQAVHSRVVDLEAAMTQLKENIEGEEDLICESASHAGSISTVAMMGGQPAPASSSKGAAAAGVQGPPPPLPPVMERIPGDSSDSSDGEYTTPHTNGKLGVNTVELIDWQKLREVRKKPKSDLSEVDKIKMRRLTAPPLRSQIKSWKRWKESVYYWARDLRRVRVSFTVMGAQILEQSFMGHDGEHAVAEQASPSRDLVEMMQVLDLKFATPTRGLLEKFEEWAPLITRDDGVAPALFLHLLGMVFEAEKRVGGPRTEHSKVTRALAALRIHNDKDTIIRAQLTSEIEQMTYTELEHVIDALQINDATRYDAKGHKPEKQQKGVQNYLSDLLGILGDRDGQGASLDHVALNKYFSGGGASAEGHILQTRGDQGSGRPGGPGQRPGGTSQPGTPRTRETDAEFAKEDEVFWEAHGKKSAEQKKQELEERMSKLRKQVDKDDYWCPYGDWCMKLRSAGFCSQQHSRPEYQRGRKKFERDHPEKYAEWLKRKKEQQSKEQREKNKAATGKTAGGAPGTSS